MTRRPLSCRAHRGRALALAAVFGCLGLARAEAQSFVPVASPEIAAHVAFATGASWIDFDGDGDLDLFVVTAFSPNNDNALFRNDGADTFTRITGSITADGAETVCSTWADADNDGDLDAFVSGLDADGSTLYRSLGDSLAADPASALTGTSIKGTGCAWGDYDADGHVDLMLTTLQGVLGMTTPDRLFHNAGDGTFTEVTSGPVVNSPGFHHHPTWADFDNDGDLDLFVASGPVGSLGPDKMYRNELRETATATFTAITTGVLATDVRDSQVLSWADYDNDGDLDCYAINYTTVGNQLYRNDGGAAFTKITSGPIVSSASSSHGVAWGDYDNDGDLDVYVVRDNGQPNRYYRNDGAGTFTSVTSGAFVTTPLSNYGVAAGDYDRDGDLDLFAPTARSEGPGVLYRNDLAGSTHWVVFRLTGGPSNRSGIGAKVRVRATIGGTPRWQLREVSGSTGYGSQSALDVHFGLGDATAMDSVRIEWPSGSVDVIPNVAADRYWNLKEGVTTLAVPRSDLPALEWSIGPQPARDAATVRFRLDTPGFARLAVLDVSGRVVGEVVESRDAGWHSVPVPEVERLEPGLYFVRLETLRGASAKRMIVLR